MSSLKQQIEKRISELRNSKLPFDLSRIAELNRVLGLLADYEKTQRENAKSFCWAVRPDKNPPPCDKMSCCYNASCKAVFDYWKFANSKEWKKIVAQELVKDKEMEK